jgi:hypothetical protein
MMSTAATSPQAADELRYAVAHMANSPFVKDMIGAAHVLARVMDRADWYFEDAGQMLERLRNDVSYSVGRAASTV